MEKCGVELQDAELLASHITAMANTGGGTVYIGNLNYFHNNILGFRFVCKPVILLCQIYPSIILKC